MQGDVHVGSRDNSTKAGASPPATPYSFRSARSRSGPLDERRSFSSGDASTATIKDNQAIDINIACLFLNKVGCNQVIETWVQQIARATHFAFLSNGPYPCVFNDYRELIDHPRNAPGYRAEATAASLLLPTLAVWAAIIDDTETLRALADFASGPYSHSTLQLWYPGSDTEEHLYGDSDTHGLATTDIKIERDCGDMLAPIESEYAASPAFESLSALKYGLWPLLIMASRHHRIPVPPQFWPFSQWAVGNLH